MDEFETKWYEEYNNLFKKIDEYKQIFLHYIIEFCNNRLQEVLGIKLDLTPYLLDKDLYSFWCILDLLNDIKKDPKLPYYVRREKNFIIYIHKQIEEKIKTNFKPGNFSLYKEDLMCRKPQVREKARTLLRVLEASDKVTVKLVKRNDSYSYEVTLKRNKK
jgi:hypothetical protein